MPMRPPLGQQTRDLSGFDGGIQHPGYATTPAAILAAWREAEFGNPKRQCDLIDDLVEQDGHLRNLFDKRAQAVAGKPSTIQAAGPESNDELAANVLRIALGKLAMSALYEHLLTYNKYGWAGAEIDWGTVAIGGRIWIVPTWFTAVKANRFRIVTPSSFVGRGAIDAGANIDDLRLYADLARPWGDALIPGKWIVVRRDQSDIARAGLMRTAAWLSMGKRFSYRDWLIFSERYGIPFPFATYATKGEHADEGAIDVATEVVRNIGQDGGAVVPDTITLDLKEPISGDNKTHPGLIAYCNNENSKLINGSTLANDSAGSGGASYALGDIHDGVRWEAVQYDAERLQTAIAMQVFEPFMLFNGLAGQNVAAPKLNIQIVRDLEPAARVLVADTLVNKLGVKVSISQLRSDTGFREPTSDADAAPGAPMPVAPKPTIGVA